MSKVRNVSIVTDVDGKSIVVINDIRFRGNTWEEWDKIEDYLKQYIGTCFEILETSERVYIGKDFPDEYSGSEYTSHLWKEKICKSKCCARSPGVDTDSNAFR